MSKQIGDITGIALGSVGDKYSIRVYLHTAFCIISADGLAKLRISLLRTIAFEGVCGGHFIHGFMKRRDDTLGQRFGHVADTEADHRFVRVGLDISGGTVRYLREQVAGFQAKKVFI